MSDAHLPNLPPRGLLRIRLMRSKESITRRTRELLSQHKIHLKKSLGQNFLVADHVLDKIVAAAELDKTVGVLEIGPGIGALTERLAASAGAVAALEIDGRLIPILRELFSEKPHVTILQGDVMEADLAKIIGEELGTVQRCHVVANLPYYVTSPILMRLLTERLPLQQIVVMVQKEVAQRLTAEPGTKAYSALTVAVRFFSEPKWVTNVSRNAFIPRPEVDSAVIRLSLRPHPAVSVRNQSHYFRVVRAAFGQRRKTLLNALAAGLGSPVDKEGLRQRLVKVGIDPMRRGETLHLEEFAHLADALEDMLTTL